MPSTKQRSLGTIAYEKLIQYELLTAVYVMEPWEKSLFNIIVIIIISLSMAAIYQYSLLMLTKLVGLII